MLGLVAQIGRIDRRSYCTEDPCHVRVTRWCVIGLDSSSDQPPKGVTVEQLSTHLRR